jgi:alpha-1,3-rhamnosyl/mannosyltransferase
MFDPHDERAMAAAIQTLLSLDESARARTRALGLARAAQFTWERTARATLDSYARALTPPGR